eukprot:TRINITY_DN3049_c0_g1_i1.p1 TRINITY_DN3049_c0_g1~~TRINITY_DN3049_c0_g1_i1.p1  ORF type:complete len:163 (+),score=20.87 TRINITY_DN3049_c0_g1_i1:69-557(+)
MITKLVAALLAIPVVHGGWPQCTTFHSFCFDRISNDFSYIAERAEMSRPRDDTFKEILKRGPNSLDEMCNRDNWDKREQCMYCPLKLVVTDPPELRTTVCAVDNLFEPFEKDAHIDLYHKLNGRETELVAVGGKTTGCTSSDFEDGKNYTGQIGRASCRERV